MLKVHSAQFVKSSPDYRDCPPSRLPEYAFIGRSNVGKSSLINMLTNRKNLAKISNKPGKTRLINHFIINDQWYLVDLPGYGWAKVSKNENSVSIILQPFYPIHGMVSGWSGNRKNVGGDCR